MVTGRGPGDGPLPSRFAALCTAGLPMWHPGRVPEVNVTYPRPARRTAHRSRLRARRRADRPRRRPDPVRALHAELHVHDHGRQRRARSRVIPPGRYQVLVTSPQPFAEIDLSGVGRPERSPAAARSRSTSPVPGVNVDTTLDDGDASADQLQATFQAGRHRVRDVARRRSPSGEHALTIARAAGAASVGGTVTAARPATPTKPTKPEADADRPGGAGDAERQRGHGAASSR